MAFKWLLDFTRRVVEKKYFNNIVILAISLNTAMLALETNRSFAKEYRQLFDFFGLAFSLVFVVEITLKLFAYRKSFFKDGWNIFDFFIVSITILPVSEATSAMRAFRVLRLLRLTSSFPALRQVVESIFRAIPGVSAIIVIFVLVYVCASIMATLLYQDISPTYFGDMATTSFTLFQIMTLESWASNIVRPVLNSSPFASLFFILFIIVTNFILINFFVAVFIQATNANNDIQAAKLDSLEKKIDELTEKIKKN